MSTKSCAYCGNTKFGLITYRHGFKKFDKRVCKEAYKHREKQEIEDRDKHKRWNDYLSGRSTT